ncbi:hypothetical protein F5883DRAFT_586129 [Diaporthe sp. PMI_573]|nr:hypothetical protein F5883DRAFT_586129 [Diaporthaceae sp. PMI_573]
MGRQEWEDSLKVDRLKIKRARMNDDDSSWIDREQTERLNEHVDGALRFLQEVPDAHLDFLNGHLESQCERLYYQTKGNKAPVNASQDTNREQRLGVLFFFNLPEWRPSRAALALLLSHCNHGHRHKNDPNQRCICSLLLNYSDKEWKRERPLRLWPYPYFKRQDFFKDRGAVTIQFMFRYAVLFETKGGTQTGDPSWPQTLRSIPSFRRGTGNTDKKATSIIERRHLLFMKYFPRNPKDHDDANPPYHFTLISLGPLRHNELHGIIRSVQEDEAKKTGDLAPIVLFIKYLRLLFLAYTEEWDDILARLDREISFKLSEVEDYSEGSQNHAMMYDDASQNTSTAYFKLFQVLRTLEGMVKETLADFRDWHFKVVTTLDGPSHAFEERQLQAAVGEWRVLGENLKARLGEIRQKIAEKRADVQSLSDNVRSDVATKLLPSELF